MKCSSVRLTPLDEQSTCLGYKLCRQPDRASVVTMRVGVRDKARSLWLVDGLPFTRCVGATGVALNGAGYPWRCGTRVLARADALRFLEAVSLPGPAQLDR